MKFKKIILNGLWVLILLFAFGGTPACNSAVNEPPTGAVSAYECSNIDSLSDPRNPNGGVTTRSMFVTREANGCSTDLTTVKFFEKADCKGKPTFGKVGSDAGKVVCSDVSGGCDECLFQEQNSPIVFTYWNGSGFTTMCFEDPLTPANDECCTIHQINC